MSDILPIVLIVGIGMALATMVTRSLTVRERRFVYAGFIAHVVAGIVHVMVVRYYYGGGDMMAYYRVGTILGEFIIADPGTYVPRVLELVIRSNPVLPIHIVGAGGATGAMFGLSTFALLLTGGSLYASSILFGGFAFGGQLAIYRALRDIFPDVLRTRMLAATLFVPSVVFWSSAMMKESIALGGVGVAFLGLHRALFTDRVGRGVVYVLAGSVVISFVKPYILFPLAVATAAWYFRHRTREVSGLRSEFQKLAYLLISTLIAVVAISWLGERYPRYSVENVADEAAHLQTLYYETDAGSTYKLGESAQASGAEQIQFAPLALISSLFRPFFFEVHNAASAINAMETSVIPILLLLIVRRRGILSSVRLMWRSPTLTFCAVFVLTMGVAIGLGAPNLGSLSRYRVPMMPFYAAILLVLLPLSRFETRDRR